MEEETPLTAQQTHKFDTSLFLKYSSLILLTVQSSANVLLVKFTRISEGCNVYSVAMVVLLSEILKLFTCLFFMVTGDDSCAPIMNPVQLMKMLVPALLFVIQNNLQITAASFLTASTLQVLAQSKIIVTAFFGCVLLKKTLSLGKCASLLVMSLGVVLSQLMQFRARMSPRFVTGCILILTSAISSGFSAVYMEKILKDDETSLHIRNVQLAMLSVPIQLIALGITSPEILYGAVNPFAEFCTSTWMLVVMLAYGGILVSLVMRYADNNLKNCSLVGSIVLSSFASMWLFDWTPDVFFLVGAALVVVSLMMFVLC